MRPSLLLVLLLLLSGCKNSPEEKKQPQPTATKGTKDLSVKDPECKGGT